MKFGTWVFTNALQFETLSFATTSLSEIKVFFVAVVMMFENAMSFIGFQFGGQQRSLLSIF